MRLRWRRRVTVTVTMPDQTGLAGLAGRIERLTREVAALNATLTAPNHAHGVDSGGTLGVDATSPPGGTP